MTELKNITDVERSGGIDGFGFGISPNGEVTLINIEDGSIPFPDLLVKSIDSWFGEKYLKIEDTNSLSFVFDTKTGTKLIPEEVLSGSWNDSSINPIQRFRIHEFYINRWKIMNEELYIYRSNERIKAVGKKR